MTTVLIVIHLMVVVAMIGLVLLQRSEGGALGIGGGGGAFMTGRGAANMLTRSTGVLAAAFFATSIALALVARLETGPNDIFQNLPGQTAPATAETPAPPIPSGGGSAEDMLKELGGSAGPQTPPGERGAGGESEAGTEGAATEGGGAPAPQGGAAPQTPAPLPEGGQ
jgi:preprotein translocase subunit SecG